MHLVNIFNPNYLSRRRKWMVTSASYVTLMTQQISTKIPHNDFFICRAPSLGKKLYKQLLQKVALFHVLKLKSKQICII
jgi:hypothetical protein